MGDFELRLSFRRNATNNSGIQYSSKQITAEKAPKEDARRTRSRPRAVGGRREAAAREARTGPRPPGGESEKSRQARAPGSRPHGQALQGQSDAIDATPTWRHLPKSLAKLSAGERLRIVMLGDSIRNDTSNGLYETLVAERYPAARIEVVTNVRGGTGGTYYKDENRVQSGTPGVAGL